MYHVGYPGEPIPWHLLPREMVIKCNHSSGGLIIVSSDVKNKGQQQTLDSLNWGKHLIHSDDIDRDKVQEFFDRLLRRNFADSLGFREFAYLEIPPKLNVEELLKDERGEIPSDFKFWCINGRVEVIQVDVARYSNHCRVLYDRNWNAIPVRLNYPLPQGDVPSPRNLK